MSQGRLLIALGLCLALPFSAARAAEKERGPATEKLNRSYLKLKDSADYYLGEGVAKLSEFDGDGLKALDAARERARASLASSVRVRIISETKEQSKGGTEGNSESIESKSASLADVVLENVRVEDFVGLPESGQVTALALLSKEDYRRQLAGKSVHVYRPEYSVRLGLSQLGQPFLDKLNDDGAYRATIPANTGQGGSSNSGGYAGGIELGWNGFVLGVDYYSRDLAVWEYDPKQSPTFLTGNYHYSASKANITFAQVGYDYTPWAWRVQPYIPLRVEAAFVGWMGYTANPYGALTGLGVRYWPSDGFALDLCYRYHVGFGSAALSNNGRNLQLEPGQDYPAFSLNGDQLQLGISWSGF